MILLSNDTGIGGSCKIMIPLTDEERVSMSISSLVTYTELLNELKQEVKKIKSEE